MTDAGIPTPPSTTPPPASSRNPSSNPSEPRESVRPRAWLYEANLAFSPAIRWFWKARVFGADRVPPSGPLLVAMNHASYLDPWFLGATFPRAPIRWLINERWYYRSRIWTVAFRAWGVIPVATGHPVETVGRVVAALQTSDVVGVFPEGRISSDGKPSPGRSGVGWMAARSGVPVVPCGLRGSFQALPRQKYIPTRHPLELHIGEPMRFPGAPVPSPKPAEIQAFVADLMGSIRQLALQDSR